VSFTEETDLESGAETPEQELSGTSPQQTESFTQQYNMSAFVS